MGHAAVRAALRDTDTYSSNLQGDADVRDYRQIPLEVDPPDHHLFRTALSPIFVKPRIDSMRPQFAGIANRILDEFEQRGGGDFISDVALRYVVSCLGEIFGRPQDVEEWLSWGAGVWETDGPERSGDQLHNYLARVYEEVEAQPGDDAWSLIADIHINGSRITYEQFKGIGSVSLAGGRDTVVKLLTGATWHLLLTPADADALTTGAVSLTTAIQELLRYLTPLPSMARVLPDQQSIPDDERDPSKYASVEFVSANFDATVFPAPDVIDFTRTRISHLAFGFGPHT